MQVKSAMLASGIVAVMALSLAGCGSRANYTDGDEVAAYSGLTDLPEQLGQDGTTITVGDPHARTTVRVYEDLRCPVVEEFERVGGASVLHDMTVRRETKTQYTLASFRDDRIGGDGSKRAVNALRAALEAEKFAEYHAVLFEHQAEAEAADGFTTAYLLKLAGKVDGLRSKSFDSAVETMKYRSFVARSEKAYEKAGGSDPRGPGTPTFVINGRQVPDELYGWLFDKELSQALLTDIQQDPGRWKSGS